MSAPAPRILVVSPVRNEVAHIERVVRAMAAQRLPPARWVVIDDHSTDGTLELLRRLEPEVPFMDVRRHEASAAPLATRDRLARAAAPINFNAGLMAYDWREFTHVMKLDGDIELPPDYFSTLMARFAADPTLGIAAGVLEERAADGSSHVLRTPRDYVHGALKCYSRDCFEAIGGIRNMLGWDTIDGTYARMRGFRVESFTDLVSVHHRASGSADGLLRGRARHGTCAYITQQHPLWVLLRSVKVGTWKPRVISGFAYLFGYVRAALARVERVSDPEFRAFMRRDQRRRMLAVLRR